MPKASPDYAGLTKAAREIAKRETTDRRKECTCPGGPNDSEQDFEACIGGSVYGYCESEYCAGVCDNQGKCDCPLHASQTHNSGYGGVYSD